MKALVYEGDERASIQEYEVPELSSGHIKVKVSTASVCGTDIHKFKDIATNVPIIDGVKSIAGHEPAGWIAEKGPDTAAHLAIGERILIAGVFGCGKCENCLAGYNTACTNATGGLHWNFHGGTSEYVVIPHQNAIPLPENISMEVASVLSCAGGTAMTIIEDARLTSEKTLLILGLGPVGLCLLILAKSMGCRVVGIDPMAERAKKARELGIDLAIEAVDVEANKQAMEWSSNRGFDVLAECVGIPATQEQCFTLAAQKATIAVAGINGQAPIPSVMERVMDKGGLTLVGIAATPIKYLRKMLKIASEKNLPFEQLITHRFQMDGYMEALDLMKQSKCGKVILEISKEF